MRSTFGYISLYVYISSSLFFIIKERNIFKVVVNKNNDILVEEKLMNLRDVRAAAVKFLDNGGGIGEEACDYCKGEKDPSSSDNPDKAIISLKNG